MRDYDLEEFLMHYGTKGMNRPKGLKYRTKNNSGSTSVYQHRRDQMYGNVGEEKESSKEWKKEKYIRDVNNHIERNPAEDYYQSRTAKKTASSSGYNKYRKQAKGYNNWDKSVKGNDGYSKTESNKNQNNKDEDAKEKMQKMQDRLLGRKKSKSKYGSKCLAHYGIPNMKRPSGLKYKTKNNGSTSLYQRRQEQMHGDQYTTDEDLRRKAKVKLLTYGQRNSGVNSPEKRAKREEDRKKFQEELNRRVAERERNEQEKLETAKKKMQKTKNKLLGKSEWKPEYSNGFMAKQKKEMAKKLASSVKNIGPSDWTKRIDSMKTQMSKKANANEANKQLKAIEANNKIKSNSLYNTIARKSNVPSKYGNDNVKSEIKKKNAMQRAKKIKKNGYKG